MHIIGGLYRGRRLIVPKGTLTKPTTGRLREAVFSICQNSIEGALFLDLYAGSGAMGLEALSRNALHATFIDKSREAIRSLNQNAENLGVQASCEILQGDAFATLNWLKKQNRSFNIIYADPPYQKIDVEFLIRFIDESSLLTPGGTFFIEESPECKPYLSLSKLRLKSNRHMGNTMLQEYFCN